MTCTGPPTAPQNIFLEPANTSYIEQNSSLITLQWGKNDQVSNYFIQAFSKNSTFAEETVTTMPKVELTLPSDEDFMVTVISNNCAGNSSQAAVTTFSTS